MCQPERGGDTELYSEALGAGWEGAGGGWARSAVGFSIFKGKTQLQPEVFNYLHGTEREKCVKLHFLFGNRIDMNSLFKIGKLI